MTRRAPAHLRRRRGAASMAARADLRARDLRRLAGGGWCRSSGAAGLVSLGVQLPHGLRRVTAEAAVDGAPPRSQAASRPSRPRLADVPARRGPREPLTLAEHPGGQRVRPPDGVGAAAISAHAQMRSPRCASSATARTCGWRCTRRMARFAEVGTVVLQKLRSVTHVQAARGGAAGRGARAARHRLSLRRRRRHAVQARRVRGTAEWHLIDERRRCVNRREAQFCYAVLPGWRAFNGARRGANSAVHKAHSSPSAVAVAPVPARCCRARRRPCAHSVTRRTKKTESCTSIKRASKKSRGTCVRKGG